MTDIRPLKRKAAAIGGVLDDVLAVEPDNISAEEYRAKCGTWLAILGVMMEVKNHGGKKTRK